MLPIGRREFLVYLGSLFASGKQPPLSFPTPKRRFTESPIIPISGTQQTFSGDDPSFAHSHLWRKSSSLRREIAAATEYDAIIVGGGISGLLSAYYTKGKKILLIELADRIGGNSRGESWDGISYSMGAAYIGAPEKGSPLHKLMVELGLDTIAHVESESAGSITDKKWNAKGGPTAAFKKFLEKEVPSDLFFENQTAVQQLDRENLEQYLQRRLGNEYSKQDQEYVRSYCFSAFGGLPSEMSAASGIYFLAGEKELWAFPGGNAAISERLYHALKARGVTFLSRSPVTHVEAKAGMGYVTFAEQGAQTRVVKSKKVVLACPKFVVKRILDGCEEPRMRAMDHLEYRSYLVANLLLKHPMSNAFYDAYCLPDLKLNFPEGTVAQAHVSDLVNNRKKILKRNSSVLTLYTPIPYSDVRSGLLKLALPAAQKNYRDLIVQQILPVWNIAESSIQEIRISRWGHAIPLSRHGLYQPNQIETLSKPFEKCVHFVNQDNWALPCFETAFHEAYRQFRA